MSGVIDVHLLYQVSGGFKCKFRGHVDLLNTIPVLPEEIKKYLYTRDRKEVGRASSISNLYLLSLFK